MIYAVGPLIERHGGNEAPPLRRADESIGDQDALYRKHFLAASQDMRANLVPLAGTMRWPVPMLDFRRTLIHYSPEGHPPSLTIETPPFTPVVSPADARVVHVESADISDRRQRPLAMVKLHAPESHMTIVLKDLLATSLPDKLRDSVRIHSHPGVEVNEGEVLGNVGRVVITMYPEQGLEVSDNSLFVQMAYQPRGPSEHFSHYDIVDPLPFFQQLY